MNCNNVINLYLVILMRERDHLEDPGLDSRIELKCILKKTDGHGVDLSGSAQEQVVGCFKCSNEPSGSMNCGESD